MGVESPMYVIMHELNISSLRKYIVYVCVYLRFKQCLNVIQKKLQYLLCTQSKLDSFCSLKES